MVMKRIRSIILVALAVALIVSSCNPVMRTTRTGAFYPNADKVQLRISMDDLVMLGETEIDIAYETFMGIAIIREVNGEMYDKFKTIKTDIKGLSFGSSSRLDKAAGKIIDEFPGAAYYYVVYKKKEIEKSFLSGKAISEKALIRVYDYKINLKE